MGAAGLEKGQVTSPPPPRPEPGLESERRLWREVLEHIEFKVHLQCASVKQLCCSVPQFPHL